MSKLELNFEYQSNGLLRAKGYGDIKYEIIHGIFDSIGDGYRIIITFATPAIFGYALYFKDETCKLLETAKKLCQEHHKAISDIIIEHDKNSWINLGQEQPEENERILTSGGFGYQAHILIYKKERPQYEDWMPCDIYKNIFTLDDYPNITYWKRIGEPDKNI